MLPTTYAQGLSQEGTGDHYAHNIALARTKDPSSSLNEALGPLAEGASVVSIKAGEGHSSLLMVSGP